MKVSYYPGCSLHGTALEYAESAEVVCKILDIGLEELDDWNCCGASSAHSTDTELAISLAARNLEIAEKAGLKDLVIPCAACFQRTKVAEYELLNHPDSHKNFSYKGDVKAKDLLNFICEDVGLDSVIKKIKKPLKELKAVCYYGCLTMRPPRITGEKNYENPQNMDKLLTALGVEVLSWPYKTDCCGGSLILTRPDIVRVLVKKLYEMALLAGAECIVAGCPLCHGNLDQRQEEISREFGKEYDLPIFYYTELMGLAMGSNETTKWLGRHLVDPKKLLTLKNLI
ncbi:MAG: CoB--CoM heterodisulfide reductase iron-sulfur subunit B family protein [Thermodesulfobacteriota bacterium]|nr:CoB--CoM heterodisulfide reductase iron-sulfur subunit B family protein [Thermodesulfobacteriota bacterium]